ncbi:MAG: hypothetical protein O7C60_05175, partial [Rickettsia endosymbiont of Ixodes persulcatus]|nr:hypothetical protein [Rickettsia endosymbiont of Ixodes persulcatus]
PIFSILLLPVFGPSQATTIFRPPLLATTIFGLFFGRPLQPSHDPDNTLMPCTVDAAVYRIELTVRFCYITLDYCPGQARNRPSTLRHRRTRSDVSKSWEEYNNRKKDEKYYLKKMEN